MTPSTGVGWSHFPQVTQVGPAQRSFRLRHNRRRCNKCSAERIFDQLRREQVRSESIKPILRVNFHVLSQDRAYLEMYGRSVRRAAASKEVRIVMKENMKIESIRDSVHEMRVRQEKNKRSSRLQNKRIWISLLTPRVRVSVSALTTMAARRGGRWYCCYPCCPRYVSATPTSATTRVHVRARAPNPAATGGAGWTTPAERPGAHAPPPRSSSVRPAAQLSPRPAIASPRYFLAPSRACRAVQAACCFWQAVPAATASTASSLPASRRSSRTAGGSRPCRPATQPSVAAATRDSHTPAWAAQSPLQTTS
ncbi:hypothetical protein JB92DRAFT_1670793 [Gautieria morchelliformis]|nr:hypothetical protein JB92DRAFT_1670793 [Gautieria morchelliformis]